MRRHEKAIQDEIENLQNESRSYRRKSSPRRVSPIRNKYAEDMTPPTNYAKVRPARTDVKITKVINSRSNSNIRQRPEVKSSRPLKVINARVDNTD